MSQSEVALLMQRVREEFEAGQRALHGLSLGTAQHKFITERMENIGKFHEDLQALVGDEAAMPLLAQVLEQLPESSTNPV